MSPPEGSLKGKGRPRARVDRRLGSDDRAVSEIVGALLLIVIVASAAFGLGVFLSAQAKATEAQKAAELQKSLEKLEVAAIRPVDALDAACASGSDGTWDALNVTVRSDHLHDSRIIGLRVNGHPARFVTVLGTTYDFDVAGTSIPLAARASLTLQLTDVDPHASGGACPPTPDYSLFGDRASQALATSDALEVTVETDLLNDFTRVAVPPSAVAALEAAPGLNATYSLVGTASTAAEGSYLVRWTWDVWQDTCVTGANHLGPLWGHRVERTFTMGQVYCARLTVTDQDGLWATTDVTFTA